MGILSNVKKYAVNAFKKFKEFTLGQSKVKVRELLKERKRLSSSDFKPGNLIFGQYDAKDKSVTYDKTPLVLILKRGGTHTLGLNFHWAPLKMRILLIKLIIQSNRKNIENGKPLEFSYDDLRPLLKRLGYAPIIRMYINKRFGKIGVVIPPERLLEIARLRTETFTNGRYSAAAMIAMASKR